MIRLTNKMIFVMAIVFSLLAFFSIYTFLQSQVRSRYGQLAYVAASEDIKMGTTIAPSQIHLEPYTGTKPPLSAFSATNQVASKIARKDIKKGETLVRTMILDEGDNFSDIIPTGMRAMTITVSQGGDIFKFLRVGNYVDVIVTLETRDGERVTKTLLQNSKILSIGKQPGKGIADIGQSVPITIAVTPEDAERLALAISQGRIQIALRKEGEAAERDASELMALDALLGIKRAPISKVIQVASSSFQGPPTPKKVEVIRGTDRSQESLE